MAKKTTKSGIGVKRSAQLFLVAVTVLVLGWLLLSDGGLLRKDRTKPLPVVKVSAWENKASAPSVNPTVKTYALKQNLSKSELKRQAQSLVGVDTLENLDGVLYGYNWGSENENNISAYTVNPSTGAFSYAGGKGKPLGSSGTVVEKADHFLSGLIADSTLTATASYRRHDKPGVVFVEFHRDWQKAGLPILNAFGLLNLEGSQKLSKLSLTSRSDKRDAQIHGTSDIADGLARQTDFNSVTVGINEQSSAVVSLISNLRQLKGEEPQSTKLVAYDRALNSLTANKYDFIYTSPAGEGTPAFDKVYPGGKVVVEKAVIEETMVAYLEEAPGVAQAKLEPYYLFRGTARLESGYNAKFVAGVAASQKRFGALAWWPRQIARAESGTGGSTGIIGPPPPPTPPPPPPPPVVCVPSVSDLTNISNVSPGVNVGQLRADAVEKVRRTGDNARAGDWYMYPTSGGLTASDVMAALEALKNRFPDVNQRNPYRVQAELEGFRNNQCPIRLTGKSPSVFVYGPMGSSYKIKVGADVTYSDPGLRAGEWSARVQPGGLLINGLLRPYLYYEYRSTDFNRPMHGWLTTKQALPKLASDLSRQLGLNDLEAERLLFELKHASRSTVPDELFVGLVDREEVESKLPLSVNPTISSTRLHFYVGARAGDDITAPTIGPIVRDEAMVLEIGASSGR